MNKYSLKWKNTSEVGFQALVSSIVSLVNSIRPLIDLLGSTPGEKSSYKPVVFAWF